MKNYLSPKQLARAIGVSESSIKRWADAGRLQTTLTAGGHRRIPWDKAVRFVREARTALVRPELLGLGDLSVEESDPIGEEMVEQLRVLLENGSFEFVRKIQALYLRGMDVARIIDSPLCRAMERIGELWKGNRADGVFREHRATQICVRGLHELGNLSARPEAGAPVALGGAFEGDPYIVPSMAAGVVVESVGFSSTNLGPETPVESLSEAIRDLRPRLVWACVTAPTDGAGLVRNIDRTLEAVREVGAILIAGGRESGSLRSLSRADFLLGTSMGELAALARGLIRR